MMRPLQSAAGALCIMVFAMGLQDAALAQKPSVTRKIYKEEDPAEAALRDLLAQGQADLDKKDFAGAVDAYQKYLAHRPEDATAHFQLAYGFTGLQKPEQAAPEYKRAIELDPKMSAAYLNLGLLELDRAPAQAVEPLRKAAELLADQARPRFLLGYALERSGQADAAIQEYQAAEQLDARSFDIHIALARVLLAANRTADAQPEFRQALVQRPDSGPARLGLAQCLIAQKKPDDASRELKAYLDANPNDIETRAQQASLLFDAGKAEEALGELDHAGPAANASVTALKLRADIYTSMKKPADAAAALEKLIALTPQDAESRARLGHLLMTQKDYPGAVRELSAALHIDPQRNDAWHNLATAYYLSGDYPRSLAALDLLEKREPPTAGIWWVRATCYDKLNRKPEALAAYQRFLELNTNLNSDEYFVAASRARLLQREIRDKKK